MPTLKALFSFAYLALAALSLAAALLALPGGGSLPWIGVLVIALAPLVQYIWPYDSVHVTHHKVRLPKVSLCVMLGVAWVLLTADKGATALWLTFANLGGFLLHTYWVRD